MKTRFDEAMNLVVHSAEKLLKIDQEMNVCLKNKKISDLLLIEIKSYFENLRSALDYCARGIFARFCQSPSPRPRVYFPYAQKAEDLNAFRITGRIEKSLPGLNAQRPDLVVLLENFQWWNPDFQWVPSFMEINNKNKHERLSPYTSSSGHDVKISGVCVLKIPEGAGINFGPNATIKYRNKIIPAGNKRFDANNAADILGKENVSVSEWADFRFDINGESVISFLESVLAGVKKIVEGLSAKI